ncbi:MAG: V-type ATPase subunit [Clostridia bacterium]|nr:V-type ATPase subunit [Clostridia bacterium]
MRINKDEYIYAVSRIRCKENKLLSSKNIDQMISMKDAQSVERYLTEQGWGTSGDYGHKDILLCEQDSLWELMRELVGDLSCFDFFRVQNDFHNLKASIKAVYSDIDPEFMFLSGSVLSPLDIYSAVKSKEYSELPEFLSSVAQEAMSILLKTGDGQLCDAIIDKACLNEVERLGNNSGDALIRRYCEVFVAAGNIKIAVRGAKLLKSADFLLRSMADCESLDVKLLASSAARGFDEVCSYLSATDYKDSVSYIKESLSAFEKWCDNYIINLMKTQKSEPFSIGPLVAYIIAKQTEIKAVRLILTAKLNALDDGVIRERVREMYV